MFAVVAAVLTIAGLVSIADGMLQRIFGLQFRLVPVRVPARGSRSVADQAERWLHSQTR